MTLEEQLDYTEVVWHTFYKPYDDLKRKQMAYSHIKSLWFAGNPAVKKLPEEERPFTILRTTVDETVRSTGLIFPSNKAKTNWISFLEDHIKPDNKSPSTLKMIFESQTMNYLTFLNKVVPVNAMFSVPVTFTIVDDHVKTKWARITLKSDRIIKAN